MLYTNKPYYNIQHVAVTVRLPFKVAGPILAKKKPYYQEYVGAYVKKLSMYPTLSLLRTLTGFFG